MNKLISDLAEQCIIEKYNQHGNLIEDGFDYGKFAELIIQECASIVYKTCQDGDAGAQAILYEFDIDNARSQK